jgi:hypothetical protein
MRPVRESATANASASVAFVTTELRSTPRWTMVCAICGRMPLIIHSAPKRRAAPTVVSTCRATNRYTGGTPGISKNATPAPSPPSSW